MRAKKSFINLIFNIIQQFIGIIIGFILPPLIVSNYGSSINGLISTIKQIVTYAQTTGAGIASAGTYVMYDPIAKKDYKTLSGIFTAVKKMFIKAGNITSLIILMVAIIYPLFVRNDVDMLTTMCLVIMLGACGVSEFYFIGKYQALLSADQKNYIVAIAQSVGNILNLIVSVILIRCSCNIILVETGAMLVYITRVTLLRVYFIKHYKYIDDKKKPLTNKITQRRDAVVHEITALIVNNSSIVLVSLFIGLKQASVLSVYLLIFGGLNAICSIFSNAIYASFGDVIAKKEDKILQNAFDIYECSFIYMIFVIYVITYLMLMPFISIYTKNMTDISYYLPILGTLYVITGLANNIKIPARTLVIACGKFKETKKYSFIEAILNVISQIILINILGIYGAVIGCLISSVYRMFNFIRYTNKEILNIKNNRVYKRIIICSVVGVFIILAINNIIKFNILNYIMWFKYAIIIGVIVIIIYFIIALIFDRKTVKEGIKTIKMMF